jgi:two-component system osmolarity sensor histidine kinase EnvZ
LTEDGLLEARMDRKRVIIINAHIFIVWTVSFSLLLLLISYLFLRNQVRSIVQLSWAADAFGRGEDVPSFKPSGAIEVRKAARSLLRMRNRIRRYADQRTAMLAGVSHDLRTPLTRLKLELALLPKDHDASAAKADIEEMERMLDGYLAFARGEEGEQPQQADVAAIAREAIAAADDPLKAGLHSARAGLDARPPPRTEARHLQPRQQRRRSRQANSHNCRHRAGRSRDHRGG